MILLIDNYDSFTYNLYQYMGIFYTDIKVMRNDKITIEEIYEMNPDRIVLSPGPKSPAEAGICMDVVKEFYDKKPILGICLGHQSIGAAFGAKIVHAKELMHGKQSLIEHDGTGIFQGFQALFMWQDTILWRWMKIHCRQIFKFWQEPKMGKSWR